MTTKTDRQITVTLNLERETKNFAVYTTGQLAEGLLVRNVQYLGLRELKAEFGEVPLEIVLTVTVP